MEEWVIPQDIKGKKEWAIISPLLRDYVSGVKRVRSSKLQHFTPGGGQI